MRMLRSFFLLLKKRIKIGLDQSEARMTILASDQPEKHQHGRGPDLASWQVLCSCCKGEVGNVSANRARLFSDLPEKQPGRGH